MAAQLYTTTATISASGTISPAVDIENTCLVGIIMPAAWTAAPITFQASTDGVAFANAYDNNGMEITVQAAASRYIVVPPLTLVGVVSLYVRSGPNATPVTQAAQATLTLVLRPFQ